MPFRIYALALLALIAVSLAACSSAPRTQRLETGQAAVDAPYRHVLVVTLFDSAELRRDVERELVRRLTTAGAQASRMSALHSSDTDIDREAVLRQVEAVGADAVLVTQLVRFDTQAKSKNRSPKGSYKFGATPYFNVYTVEQAEYIEPPTVELTYDVAVQTDCYSVLGETKVWSIVTESHFKRDIEDQLDGSRIEAEAQAIVTALARDGLIGRGR